MRKRYKSKKRSCPICKPGKCGHAIRWTPRDLMELREWERRRKRLRG